jgi:heavy metal sensor kinase
VIGRSTEAITAELQRFAWQLILAGLLVLVVGCAGGWWISSRIFIPIAKITKSAADISVNNLSKRIESSEVESELVELVDVLNATFARLDAAFSQLVRFTADASHELRTPLAVMRSHAELALTRSRTEEYYQQTIETCLNSATRMTAIVDGLLTLARADAGGMVADRQNVELSDVVRETIRQLRPVAAKSQVNITKELEAVTVLGNSNLLGRVVSNLVENAIRYNRPGGSIRVMLLTVDDRISLTVSDTGIGIPAADVPHIFERFYRVDQARTRSTGGTGLGLAICKSIIELHGGTIECVATENSGTTFRVQIPKQTVTEQ